MVPFQREARVDIVRADQPLPFFGKAGGDQRDKLVEEGGLKGEGAACVREPLF